MKAELVNLENVNALVCFILTEESNKRSIEEKKSVYGESFV